MRRTVLIRIVPTILAGIASLSTAAAQSSSLYGDPAIRPPLRLSTISWHCTPVEEPKEYKQNDLVTVIVRRTTMTLNEGEVDNKKKASSKYALTDWIMFNGFAVKPDPQSAGDPTIAGAMDTKYKAEGGMETLNSIEFTIQCRVVDIRPNGLLLIEGDDLIDDNGERQTIKFSGIVRADDILPDNTIVSEKVHQMYVAKQEVGHVRDAYRRGWMQKFIDFVQPF